MRGLIIRVMVIIFAVSTLTACTTEQPVDMDAVLKQPKSFVGSDTCKQCHLEHYDSWKMTLHSRMTQDAQKNRDVIITPIDEKRIRADLEKLGAKLKVPADQIWVPSVEEIKYTIGSQWKQRYIVEKEGDCLSLQFNITRIPIVGSTTMSTIGTSDHG